MNRKKLHFFIVIFVLGIFLTTVVLTSKKQIPNDNYITIDSCGFVCGNSLLLDLNTNQLSVYYPYSYNLTNRVFQRKLNTDEIKLIYSIFKSEEYLDVPEMSSKLGFDGEQFEINSRIQGKEKSIYHFQSKNETVRRIIDIYYELISEEP